MYCPKCRKNYPEGILECPDCGVKLAEELPSEIRQPAAGRMKIATLLAIIGLCFGFAARILASIFPGLFRPAALSWTASAGLLISSLFFAFFYISFFRDYASDGRLKLRRAAGWAIAASVIMVLVNLKHLPGFFHVFMSQYMSEQTIGSLRIEAIFSWIASLMILYFFAGFYRETATSGPADLRKGTLAGVWGTLLGAVYTTFILWSYIFSGDPTWFHRFSKSILIILLPIIILSFIFSLYFYLKFYKCLAHKAGN